jgi:hypothetical protein
MLWDSAMRMINSSVQKKLIWQYGSHVPAGLVPISRTAVTNSSGVTISSGIDSTYDAYVFKIYNFNPVTSGAELEFQVNAVGAADFNETITSLRVYAYSDEGDSATAFGYDGTNDQANDTGDQSLSDNTGDGTDESSSGSLTLYGLADGTYVKNFVAQFTNHLGIEYMRTDITTGYFDVGTAIDEIRFQASSGNFDAIITMYGVA